MNFLGPGLIVTIGSGLLYKAKKYLDDLNNKKKPLLKQHQKIQQDRLKLNDLKAQIVSYHEIKQLINEQKAQLKDQAKQEQFLAKSKILEEQKEVTRKQLFQIQQKYKDLQKMFERAREELIDYQKKAKESNDPNMYKKAKQGIFVSFLDNIRNFQFTDKFLKIPQHRYHIVMGLISVGKSSLLTNVTGIKIKKGAGQTTAEVSRIGVYLEKDEYVEIFDSPGINDDFSCYDIRTLDLLFGMDEIFVVYKDDLKGSMKLIKIINAIRPEHKIILIRTHYDNFDKDDKLSYREQIKQDEQKLKKLEIPARVYAYSCKEKNSKQYDNEKVADLIRGGMSTQITPNKHENY